VAKIVVDYGKPQSSRNGVFLGIVFLIVASIVITLNKDLILIEFGFNPNNVKNLENQIKELKKENQQLSSELKKSFNESLETFSSFKSNNDFETLEELIKEKDAEIAKLRNQIFLKNDEIQLLSNSIDELNDEISELNENISSKLQESSNRFQAPAMEDSKDYSRKPVLKKRVVPEYPTELIFNRYRRQIEATVTVVFDISTEGIPINIKIESSSNRLFNSAALSAIKKTRFLPALNEYGNPIIYREYSFVYDFK